MTPSEFKAWFDGFTEAMEGMPTEAQWAKIKKQVKEIDGTSTTYPIYVDRYWPRPKRYWEFTPYWVSTGGAAAGDNYPARWTESLKAQPEFDSHMALYVAGQADYADLN